MLSTQVVISLLALISTILIVCVGAIVSLTQRLTKVEAAVVYLAEKFKEEKEAEGKLLNLLIDARINEKAERARRRKERDSDE